MRYLLLALLTLAPALASAQLRARVSTPPPSLSTVDDLAHGPRNTVRVSGTNLPGGRDLVVPDGGWVTSIKFAERSDDPCHLELGWATMDNGQMSTATSTFSECSAGSGPNYSSSLRGTGFNPHPRQGEYLSLKGLQVCQRNSSDKLKGIRVRAVSLNPSGSVVATEPVRENGRWKEFTSERPNCNDWDDMEMCPSGKVLVGVRIEHDDATNYRVRIKGLAPICAQLRVED